MVSDWFYVDALGAGMSVPLDANPGERAIYVVSGEVEIAGDRFEGPRLLILSQVTKSRCGRRDQRQ